MSTDIALLPLLEVVRAQAADPDLLDLLEPAPEDRTWTRLLATPEHELWLIAWPPGAATDWHDHGTSAGAFTVLRGTLTEHSFPGCLHIQQLGVGDARGFGAGYAHDVRNETDETARVLMFSTVVNPSATVYPDSDKVGIWTGDKETDVLVRRSSRVDYYDGEV